MRTATEHSSFVCNLVGIFALCLPGAAIFAQATASVGDCDPPNVQVRGKVSMRNKTGQDANDFHFYMYQNDRPNVVVTGAKVSAAGCTGAGVTLDTDNGSPNPPPGNHGAHVDVDGCNIPNGEAITVEVVLCMNERNVVKIKDAQFTHDGDPLPHPKPPPKGGWRVQRPFRGGSGGDRSPGGGGQGAQEGNGGVGKWIHLVCVENDDSRWVVLDELKLLASTTYYADLEDINWAAILPVVDANGRPPVCIPPGGRYCYLFETTGSYLGHHIYLKYKVRVADPGECEPVVANKLSFGNDDNGDEDDTVDMFGDHPVDALLTEVLEGTDFYVTTQPTLLNFGGVIPPIPADFFNPGSDPFLGPIKLVGRPIDPAAGNADTIVRRIGEAYLPDEGSMATIPIEMVALNLVSEEPFQVVPATETRLSIFDVLPGFGQTNNSTQPPTRTAVASDDGISLETLHLGFAGSLPPGVGLLGRMSDSGGPPGAFGIDSFFDVFFQATPSMPAFPPNLFMAVRFDLQLPGGGYAPMLPPTVQVFDNAITLSFDLSLPGTDGERLIHHQVTGRVGEALHLSQAEVAGDPSGISVFDLIVFLNALGPVDSGQPILALTLQSQSTYRGVASFFDVFCTLEPEFMTQGVMDLTRDSADGGTFTSMVQILPRITFVPVGGGLERVLPGVVPVAFAQMQPHPWRYAPPPTAPAGAGPNFFPSAASPLQWLAYEGSSHTVNPAMGPPCPIPFDFDGDLDVDLDDLETFIGCATGPSLQYDPLSLPPSCGLTPGDDGLIAADFDGDRDVDATDFAALQRCYGAPDRPSDPHCACKQVP